MDFREKVVLVTGGSRGIGLATASLFAERGAAVAICGRNETALQKALGKLQPLGPAAGWPCDVGDEADVDRLFAEIRDRFGRLDICVCNAGIETDEDYSFLDIPARIFDENMRTNLRGVFLTAQGAARIMKDHGGGSIILIGSTSGIMADPFAPSPTYDASKAAVHMLARSLAMELAQHHIRVNAVAPGWIDTEMSAWAKEDPQTWAHWMERIPLKRFGRPGEIAELIAFLAGDKASYMTGAVVVMDGGETLT